MRVGSTGSKSTRLMCSSRKSAAGTGVAGAQPCAPQTKPLGPLLGAGARDFDAASAFAATSTSQGIPQKAALRMGGNATRPREVRGLGTAIRREVGEPGDDRGDVVASAALQGEVDQAATGGLA